MNAEKTMGFLLTGSAKHDQQIGERIGLVGGIAVALRALVENQVCFREAEERYREAGEQFRRLVSALGVLPT
jgi:hypothetical protein